MRSKTTERVYLFISVCWLGAACITPFSDSERSTTFKFIAAGLFLLNAILYGCSSWIACRRKVKQVF